MKTSLGRRSSSRTITRVLLDNEVSRQERRSGIPIRRAISTDRNLSNLATPLAKNMHIVTPMSKRSISEDRNSMLLMSTKSQGFGGGTERPSRSTTLSTNSGRHSSYGGARMKRDSRPIEDREWQLCAQRKIEDFLMNDKDGCMLLENGSIRPINLKLFIGIVDLLLKRLDGNETRTYIHKENYITELPFVMKKLSYRGKLEKSWLISVNTARSWCHALACIDFLVTCVLSQMVIDPYDVMYPEQYDKIDDDVWNWKIVLPYLNKSFELFKSNHPSYEDAQEQLDEELIHIHTAEDNVHERFEILQENVERAQREIENLTSQNDSLKVSLQALDETFNTFKVDKSNYEEQIKELDKFIEQSRVKEEDLEKYIDKLSDDLEKRKKSVVQTKQLISHQQISQHQLEELKNKRDSLQREIDREHVYVTKYEEFVHESSMELIALKKRIDELIKSYNLEVMNYVSYGIHTALLDGKQSMEEIDEILESVKEAIDNAKLGLKKLSDSNSDVDAIQKLQEEAVLLENKMNDRKRFLNNLLTKSSRVLKDKKESIQNIKADLESANANLSRLGTVTDSEDLELEVQKEEKIVNQMEKQLNLLRANAAKNIQGFQNILGHYNAKFKALGVDAHKN